MYILFESLLAKADLALNRDGGAPDGVLACFYGQRGLGWVPRYIHTYLSIRYYLVARFFFFAKRPASFGPLFDVFTHPLIHSDMAPGSSRQEELQRLSTKVQEALEEALGS